jgi:hypothetical protein
MVMEEQLLDLSKLDALKKEIAEILLVTDCEFDEYVIRQQEQEKWQKEAT